MYVRKLFRMVMVFTGILSAAASAQTNSIPMAGVLRLSNEETMTAEGLLLDTRVSMHIEGLTNRVEVRQRFFNPTDEWMEGVYLFPLPEDSAVNRVRIELENRELVAVIQEKTEARREYEEARSNGRTAALTEQNRPNMFTQSVANIAPGEQVDVYIQYLQPVLYDSGMFSIRYPMTVTPRYTPGLPASFMQVDDKEIAVSTGQSGWVTPASSQPETPDQPHYLPDGYQNPVFLEVELDTGLPLAQVQSPTHTLDIRQSPGGAYAREVSFAAGSEPMDRDFVLEWQPEPGHEPLAAVFTEVVESGPDQARFEEHYVQVMLLPPQNIQSEKRQARELLIVLDTSGSMGGVSINAAKESVEKALKSLNPGDYFNLIEFNTGHRTLFRKAVPASDRNLDFAFNFVRRLEANGGTNMKSALKEALQMPAPVSDGSSLLRQLVFITDGSVTNESEVFQLINDYLGHARVFTVGIGSAPNSHFMTRAAEIGKGSYVYIANTGHAWHSMESLFRKLENPVITSVDIHWPDGMAVEQYPAEVPDLYLGEPVVVTARLRGDVPGSAMVSVTGRASGGRAQSSQWSREILLPPEEPSEMKLSLLDSGLATSWGSKKIDALQGGLLLGRSPDMVKAEVIDVSIRHQLLSPYTSFLAVEREISRPATRKLVSAPVPLDVPRGQDLAARMAGQGRSIQIVMPATALGTELKILVGGLALLLLMLMGLTAVSGKERYSESI